MDNATDEGTKDPAVPTAKTTSFDPTRSRAFLAALVIFLLLAAIVIAVRSQSSSPDTAAPNPRSVASTQPANQGSGPAGTFTTDVVTVPGALETTVPHQPDPLPGPPFKVATPKANGQLAIFDAPGGTVTRGITNPKTVCGSDVTIPLVLLVKRATGDGWYEVYVPERPNGGTGFVNAADVTIKEYNVHIEIRLSDYNLKAFEGNTMFLNAPIAEAAADTPTPGGTYFTTELLRPANEKGEPDPNGPYGPYAYGLSGFSEALSSFGGCPGQLGIHGTNQPQLMGQKVSHGCIRLRNDDIKRLAAKVPLGVPVQIYP